MNATAAAALAAFGVALQQGAVPDPPAGPFRSSTSLVEVDVVRAGIAIYALNARGTSGAAGRIMADASVERGTVTTVGDTSQKGWSCSRRRRARSHSATATTTGLRTRWTGMQVRARRGYVAAPLPPRRAVRRSAGL